MKQPERVAELLAELRALAETDFERHRIDVLERDLTAPPTVEVVDDTHQKFNGVTYLKTKDGHYTLSGNIHRAVWMYYEGEIPAGYHIHHIDENKDNNCIENLQALTANEHHSLHVAQPTIEKVCPVCEKRFIVPYKFRKRIFCSRACKNTAQKKMLVKSSVAPFAKKSFLLTRELTMLLARVHVLRNFAGRT